VVIDETSAKAGARGENGNLGYLFRLAHQAFRRRLEIALLDHELTVPEYSALSAFDLRREVSSAELARILEVTPQTMNAVVHQLLGRSLLRREKAAGRGKALMLRLSAQGRRRLDAATKSVRAVERAALGARSASEQRLIKRWLSELAAEDLDGDD
jgi:DNA-binding MarR family transcriptional regulator